MRPARAAHVLLGIAGMLVAFLAIHQANRKPPMNSMPGSDAPAVVRTDFSDSAAWQAIRAAIVEIPSDLRSGIEIMHAMNAASGGDVSGYDRPLELVNIVNDRRYADRTPEEVLELLAKDSRFPCLFIADRQTISSPDHPVLVVDLSHPRGRTFRAIPSEVGAIACNLSIANMGWEDFANHVDRDGVFRGFPRPTP